MEIVREAPERIRQGLKREGRILQVARIKIIGIILREQIIRIIREGLILLPVRIEIQEPIIMVIQAGDHIPLLQDPVVLLRGLREVLLAPVAEDLHQEGKINT